ncbi:hypothetical protein [Gordonia sp. C13]|uniref:hypothetical protein n=1 Tax=Gordonia sp. C13 TaxID=2935078 RepID=UPI00200B421E|nr:hypothetical protein [Gordonia sp. C13]MCK8613007.1 hypothetical protein [Gordonia sp. C13]
MSTGTDIERSEAEMTTEPAGLDWDQAVEKYRDGAAVDTLPGGATVTVSGADDERIYVKHRLWTAELHRYNLEKGVDLVNQGAIPREANKFIDKYRTLVADERPTVAATVLKDLGYLN